MITIGTRLCTKDGRKIGNGIIIDVFTSSRAKSKFNYYVVKTDFGNIVPMTSTQIAMQFYITDDIIEPKEQLSDQLILLDKVVDRYYGN